jgi:arylsulfatase A-like enzyme
VSATRREVLAAGAGVVLAGLLTRSSAAAVERPNVLVIVVDTLRADHVFGARARTPNIDALARAGLSFTRAIPEGLPTVPVRNAILSGRHSFPFRGWHDYRGLMDSPGWSPVRDPETTWTRTLRGAGYWTAYVTDNPFVGFSLPYEPLRRSFDLFVRRGGQIGGSPRGLPAGVLEHWLHPAIREPRVIDRLRLYLANGGYSPDEKQSFAARVFRSGVTALEQGARRRPFALVVDSFAPHEPWTPPPRYVGLYGDPDWRGPEPGTLRYGRVDNWLSEREAGRVLRRLRALYAAEVTMTDRWLGVLLDRLHELRLERETVIVLVSDHGIFLGERGWTGKVSVALHPELIHVPLIVVDPERRRAGQRSPYYASTHDIGRTLLSMTGIVEPQGIGGADLSQLLLGRRPAERGFAYGGYANSHYLRDDRWAFMSDNRLRRPQLYDRRSDPGETRNVADRHPALVRELHDKVVEKAGGRLPWYPE